MSGRLNAKMIRFSELGEKYEAAYAYELDGIKTQFPSSTGVEWIGVEVTEGGAFFIVRFRSGDEIRIGNSEGESLGDKPVAGAEYYGGYIAGGDPHGYSFKDQDVAYLARKLYTNAFA